MVFWLGLIEKLGETQFLSQIWPKYSQYHYNRPFFERGPFLSARI